jgi:ABC-type branched-subunit amino acid transport system ATPase component
MLKCSGVSKRFGGLQALGGVELDAESGRITGVIGPNGAGKSTLLHVIGGLLRADSGSVVLDGDDLTGLLPYQRARRGLVRTFQISRELGELTVLENLMLARLDQSGESIVGAFFRYFSVRQEEEETAERARRLLEQVGLWRLADAPARSLSGGQKKLLELSRALMLDPKIILLDEPAAGVSPPMRAQISRVIKALRDDGLSFVVVEHDMDLVGDLCDRVYVMAEGRNLAAGTFREVVSDARVVRAYLGDAA